MPEYDITIIGGGPGGYVAAIRAAQLGARVAVVEKERIGGCCLNRGCIPTKTLFRSVQVYLDTVDAARYGVDIAGQVAVNFPAMMARKAEVVSTLVGTVIELMRAHKIEIYPGVGTIVRPGLVRIRQKGADLVDVASQKIVIASGSVPARVTIPGADLPGVLTSRELLELKELPESMVIVGASVVGLEFASMFHALGTRVRILGRRTFMKAAEAQLAKRFRAALSGQGLTVDIGLTFQEIVPTDEGRLRVRYEKSGREKSVEGQIVLLSTGRWPYTEELGLEELGLKTDGRRIVVNEYLETNLPGIYAIGDVLGTYMLAHVASYEGEVAVENALGHRRAADYRAVPYCIFTLPEVAGVGLKEKEAKERGLNYAVARFPFSASGKALALGHQEGQVRIVHEKDSGAILGVHIMGPHANDLVAEAVVAMQAGATVKELAQTIHAHPTLPESVMEAAKAAAFGEAIHYKKV